MAKKYTLSNGIELKNPYAAGYHAEMDWCGVTVMTHFMLDDGSAGSADSAVKLFERVYEMREFYIMMAQHAFQVMIIRNDCYESFALMIRSESEPVWKTDAFSDLLEELEVKGISFGNDGKMYFHFYHSGIERYYDAQSPSSLGRG